MLNCTNRQEEYSHFYNMQNRKDRINEMFFYILKKSGDRFRDTGEKCVAFIIKIELILFFIVTFFLII